MRSLLSCSQIVLTDQPRLRRWSALEYSRRRQLVKGRGEWVGRSLRVRQPDGHTHALAYRARRHDERPGIHRAGFTRKQGCQVGVDDAPVERPSGRCAGGCLRDCRQDPRGRARGNVVNQPPLQRRCQRTLRCRTRDHLQVERLTEFGGGDHRDFRESRAQVAG